MDEVNDQTILETELLFIGGFDQTFFEYLVVTFLVNKNNLTKF